MPTKRKPNIRARGRSALAISEGSVFASAEGALAGSGELAHAQPVGTATRNTAPWKPSRLRALGVARVIWNLARVFLVVIAILMLVAIRGSVSVTTYALTVGVCFSALVVTLGLRRDVIVATGYILGFAVFSLLRGLTDGTPVPVQSDYVIWLERLIPGPLPTIWIQSHMRTAGEVSFLDRSMTAVHLSYFFSPLAVGAALWRWRRELFQRYVFVLLTVYYVGLVASLVLPTAPPWVASNSGQLPYVEKVVDWVYGTVNVEGYAHGAIHMNPVAAMPSLHMAITTAVALAMARLGRPWAVVGAAYVLLMAFALVYLGEHYVTDEVAGVLLGLGVWTIAFGQPRGWRKRHQGPGFKNAAAHSPAA